MPPAPRLSIGMPVFNGSKWIPQAVESLLTQSFTDFELVIADNASTDDTEHICRTFAAEDHRIRYERNPVNIGIHRNYDRVFERSTAAYFKWASCSDICLDGFLEKCVAVLDARPDVVLAYPKAVLIYATSITPGRPGTPDKPDTNGEYGEEYDDNLDLQQDRPSDRFREYLNRERLNNVMNGVIRSAALRETALNKPVLGSDISMVAELALRGKFVEIPDRLFLRRLTPQTTAILMATPDEGYLGQPDNVERAKLHSYRFLTTLNAPISMSEKWRVWLYLLRRITWLRHRAFRRVLRLATGRR